MVWLVDCEQNSKICVVISTEYTSVTDTHTDGRTPHDSEEGAWAGRSQHRSLLAVPNVTSHPSTASVTITVLLYNGPLLCGFNVPIKGLTATTLCYFRQTDDDSGYSTARSVDYQSRDVLAPVVTPANDARVPASHVGDSREELRRKISSFNNNSRGYIMSLVSRSHVSSVITVAYNKERRGTVRSERRNLVTTK